MNKLEIVLRYRRILILLCHFFIFSAAYFLAFLLRFDFHIPAGEMAELWRGLPLAIGIQMIIFGSLGQFHGLWQYVAMDDLVQLIKANVLSCITFIVCLKLLGMDGFPRAVILLDVILALGMTCALRFSFKVAREVLRRQNSAFRKHNVLIVGAGDAGVRLLREILRNPRLGGVVGFVDDDPKKLRETIQNIKIMGNRKDIPRIVAEFEVDEVVLAIPSASGKDVRDILAYCEKTKVKIRVVPSWNKIVSGQMELKPRDAMPEDLLGRETVKINTDDVKRYIQGNVVLVTGAGGSIGSEICRQVAYFAPKELILFDHHENFVYFLSVELRSKYPNLLVRTVIGDIRDVGLLKHIFAKMRPQVVFHAAAHKHVPLMEDSPTAAVKNNVFGSRNIIYACHHYGVQKLVQISTDKAVNPVNAMGMSKRVAEIILQSRAQQSRCKSMAVRFGNVLGSAGSVVPLFKKQINYGGPLTVTHPDVKRYFMSIKEAVMLVLQAGAIGEGGEIFILDMGDQIKVIDIAKNLVALSGLNLGKDIQIEFTGLRPGEKLEEELLLDKEKDALTKHNKIYVSRNPVVTDREALRRAIKKLHRLTELMDEDELLKVLKDIIDLGDREYSAAKPKPAPAVEMPLPVRRLPLTEPTVIVRPSLTKAQEN